VARDFGIGDKRETEICFKFSKCLKYGCSSMAEQKLSKMVDGNFYLRFKIDAGKIPNAPAITATRSTNARRDRGGCCAAFRCRSDLACLGQDVCGRERGLQWPSFRSSARARTSSIGLVHLVRRVRPAG